MMQVGDMVLSDPDDLANRVYLLEKKMKDLTVGSNFLDDRVAAIERLEMNRITTQKYSEKDGHDKA